MINFRWFLIVCTGLLAHLSDVCLFGLCCQHKDYDAPNLGSALFVFCALIIVTAHSLVPPAMVNMHRALSLFFELGMALVICDFSVQTIWLPFLNLSEKCFYRIADYLRNLCDATGIPETCSYAISAMESKSALHTFASIIAVILTVYTLESTDTFTHFRDYFSDKMGCSDESEDQIPRRRGRRSRSRGRNILTNRDDEDDEYDDD